MEERKREAKPAAPRGRDLYEWIGALVCVVLAAVAIFTFAVRLVLVDGGSMRETLQHGDCLLTVSRLLCGDPAAGDIVILRRESFRDGEPIVKRVIAVEGQTVDIDFDAGVVYVDGAALEEDYIHQPTYLEEGLDFPVTVPEGCVFVLGDNRNDSDDSRDPDLGPVDVREILGQAVLLLFPGVTESTGARDYGRIGPLA